MFGLSFLSPIFLAGAAAALIPIALHLFYRRTEPVVEFAAMRYLRQSPVQRSRRRRLRELVLLALRVSALVLLAWAFARPYFAASAAGVGQEATVVLVDASASLTAPGQFDRVRARAEQAVRGAPVSHAVGLVRTGGGTTVVTPVSPDRAAALAGVASLQSGAGATRVQEALHRAGEALGGRAGRIVIVTDLQQSGWDAGLDAGIPANVAVEVEDVGGPDTNLALVSLRVEGREAIATVQSFPPRAMTESVRYELDGRLVGAVPVEIAADGHGEVRLRLDASTSGALSAAVTDADGYAADNVRYVVAGDEAALSVVAISASPDGGDALYLQRALRAADGTAGFRVRAVNTSAFGTLDPAIVDSADVVVVAATRGLEQRGRERLAGFARSGGGIFVVAGPDIDPAVLRQALGDAAASRWSAATPASVSLVPADARHPILRVFDGAGTLGAVSVSRIVRIDAAPGARVLARFTDGTPALLEPDQERNPQAGAPGRVLVFASDLNNRWNDFPLQPSFVPFVHESVRYLAGMRRDRTDYVAGELAAPGGDVPGVIAVDRPGRGAETTRVAVNVDPRESDPRRMSADLLRAGITRLEAGAAQRAELDAAEREDRQGLWRYGMLLMFASVALEGLLGRGVT